MFSAKPTDDVKPASGLFGAPAAPGSGMFGAKSEDSDKPTGGLFATLAAPGDVMFGAKPAATDRMVNLGGTPTGKSLFGGSKPEENIYKAEKEKKAKDAADKAD